MMQLRVSSKKQAKIKLALQGCSGAGKTYSALLLAYGLCGDWSKIAIIDSEDIILLASHCADNVIFTLQNLLHESIDSWSDFLPISEAVALQVCMILQQVIPTLGNGIYDDDFHSCILTYPYCFHIGFGSKVVLKRKYIVIA